VRLGSTSSALASAQPLLLALSASSPFWEGTDTGYASYRTLWFARFPVTGSPLPGTERYSALGFGVSFGAYVAGTDAASTSIVNDASARSC